MKNTTGSSKSKHRVTIGSSNCKFGHVTKRIESSVSNCYLHTHVHSSIIHNDQKAEAFQMSIYSWMDKQNVVYTDNECLVAQLFLTLCNPIDCSPPGSSVHGIFQARILEWAAISFSRRSSPPRDQAWVSCIAGIFFTNWAARDIRLCHTWVHIAASPLCVNLDKAFNSLRLTMENSVEIP